MHYDNSEDRLVLKNDKYYKYKIFYYRLWLFGSVQTFVSLNMTSPFCYIDDYLIILLSVLKQINNNLTNNACYSEVR